VLRKDHRDSTNEDIFSLDPLTEYSPIAAAGVRCDEGKGGRIGSGPPNERTRSYRPSAPPLLRFKFRDNSTPHLRFFLADRYDNTDDILPLLVDDRVDCHGGFSGLTVADDELALVPGKSESSNQSLLIRSGAAASLIRAQSHPAAIFSIG